MNHNNTLPYYIADVPLMAKYDFIYSFFFPFVAVFMLDRSCRAVGRTINPKAYNYPRGLK